MKPLTATPAEEERAARERQRRLDKLQREAARARAREERSKRATVIREELARPQARRCRCGITTRTTREELDALAEGCTGSVRGGRGYICPVLDAIRRRL